MARYIVLLLLCISCNHLVHAATYLVGPLHFFPIANDSGIYAGFIGDSYTSTFYSDSTLYARVSMPVGSRVTKFECTLYDGSGQRSATANFVEVLSSDNAAMTWRHMATVGTSASGSAGVYNVATTDMQGSNVIKDQDTSEGINRYYTYYIRHTSYDRLEKVGMRACAVTYE